MDFDWKATLRTVAPALATALGGPMAGVAVRIAAQQLGHENPEQATANDIAAAVATGDTDVLLKLRQADSELRVRLRELDIRLEELEVEGRKIDAGDRADARGLAKARGLAPQGILSSVFVGGFVYILGLLFGGQSTLPDEMMQPAMYLLGILSAGITQIMNFWFGSSAGSREKDRRAAEQAMRQPPTVIDLEEYRAWQRERKAA